MAPAPPGRVSPVWDRARTVGEVAEPPTACGSGGGRSATLYPDAKTGAEGAGVESASVPLGSLWSRLVAAIIDLVPLPIAMGVAQVSLSDYSAQTRVWLVVGCCLSIYLVSCWATTGQTIGMRLFGLRVVRASDGKPLGWSHAILRLVVCVPSLYAVFVGFAWAAFDARKRGWHDMAAGSVVEAKLEAAVSRCPTCGSNAISIQTRTVDPRTGHLTRVAPTARLLWALSGVLGVLLIPITVLFLIWYLQYGSQQQTGDVIFHYDLWRVGVLAVAAVLFIGRFWRGLPLYWPSSRNRAILCRCGDCPCEWSTGPSAA
ncbi:MAG: RDD family protein [Candidatus Limnocylindrales bacterium]